MYQMEDYAAYLRRFKSSFATAIEHAGEVMPKKIVSIVPVESLIFSPESSLETKPSATSLAYLFGVTKAGG